MAEDERLKDVGFITPDEARLLLEIRGTAYPALGSKEETLWHCAIALSNAVVIKTPPGEQRFDWLMQLLTLRNRAVAAIRSGTWD